MRAHLIYINIGVRIEETFKNVVLDMSLIFFEDVSQNVDVFLEDFQGLIFMFKISPFCAFHVTLVTFANWRFTCLRCINSDDKLFTEHSVVHNIHAISPIEISQCREALCKTMYQCRIYRWLLVGFLQGKRFYKENASISLKQPCDDELGVEIIRLCTVPSNNRKRQLPAAKRTEHNLSGFC